MSQHLGVQFVYEETKRQAGQDERHTAGGALTPTAMAKLPIEWTARLKQGAEDVDVKLLFSVIEQIRERDGLLADALTQLVDDFDYDEILAVIQQRMV